MPHPTRTSTHTKKQVNFSLMALNPHSLLPISSWRGQVRQALVAGVGALTHDSGGAVSRGSGGWRGQVGVGASNLKGLV